MAYQSLYRRYRPRRFGELRGQEHVVTRPAQRRARGPRRPRLPLQRAPRHGQDVGGPHPGQGPQLRAPGRRRAVPASASRASPSRPAPASTSTSSTPPRTTASTPSATSSSARRSARRAARRCTSSTRSTCCPGRAEAALLKTLEEPPDARRVRAGHHRPAEGQRHDPQPHPALRVPPAAGRRARGPTSADVVADAGLDVGADAVEDVVRQGAGSARDTLSALDQVVAAGGVLERERAARRAHRGASSSATPAGRWPPSPGRRRRARRPHADRAARRPPARRLPRRS